MIPIQDSLHRIQWDSDFGKAEFVIGYLDRVSGTVARVPFRRVRFPSGEQIARQRADPPVIVLHPIWHWTLADRKACATFGAFDLGQWEPHMPPVA